MFQLELAFDSPGYLWLLLLIPVLWIWSFNSLVGPGPCAPDPGVALAFAGAHGCSCLHWPNVQLLQRNDRLTVIYLLDQSASIPREAGQAMVEYVVKDVERIATKRVKTGQCHYVWSRSEHRSSAARRSAADLPAVGIGRHLATDATNLEAAMKLAQAIFPEDALAAW